MGTFTDEVEAPVHYPVCLVSLNVILASKPVLLRDKAGDCQRVIDGLLGLPEHLQRRQVERLVLPRDAIVLVLGAQLN